MAEVLDIELQKTQLSDGRWMLYYPGTDLDLSCGTYYLKVMINGVPWYSELFIVKNVNPSTYPGLIKDTPHCALRFYDTITKQSYYRCQDLCDLTINPIDHIVPFVIDISDYNIPNTSYVNTKIICHDGSYEYDLTSELQYEIDSELNSLIQKGNTLSSQLYCGIYYLELTILVSGDEVKLYSDHFKISNITNVQTGETFLYTESESGFVPIITGDDNEIILNL